jgi:GAF domain-containing protein
MRRVTSSGELAKLRTTLLQPALRVAAVVALPLTALAIYDVIRTGVLWPIVFVAGGYAVLLAGAWIKFDAPWRAWSLPLAMCLFGFVELVLHGKAGDAQAYLLGSVIVTGLFIGERKSYQCLAGGGTLLLIFLGLRGIGRFTPLSNEAYAFSLGSWIGSLVVFVGIGGGLIGLLNTVLPRLANALSQRDVTSTMLQENRSALKGRAARLKETNEELRRRAEYVGRGLSIAESLSMVTEFHPLLDRATRLIADRFELDDVRVYTVDNTGEWAYLRAASSEFGRRLIGDEYRVRRGDESAVSWVLDHQSSRTYRLSEDGEFAEETISPGIRMVFVVPLLVGDKLFGVLELQSAELEGFTDEKRAALESVGQQLALSVANARQLGDEARALEIASPFYRAAQQLAEARTDRDVYAVILETLQDFDADRVLLVRFGVAGDYLVVAADLQGDQLTFSSQDLAVLGMQSVIDVVVLGLALETSLWVEDIEDAERTFSPEMTEAMFDLADETGVAAMAFVPLQVEEETLGGMLTLHEAPHTFSPVEQRLYEFMGELGGAALERSALVREAEIRLQREQRLSQVGRRLRASLDPDTVVRIAIEEIGRVLDVPLADIEFVEDAERGAEMGTQVRDLVIPLGDETEPLGWVNVRIRDDRAIEERDWELVEALAVEAGRALESARLFTETQATLQEADVLYRGSRALVETRRTDELLRVFVDSLVTSDLDRCMLLMVDRSGSRIGGEIQPARLRVEAVWEAATDDIRYRPGGRWRVDDLPVLGTLTGEVIVVEDLIGNSELDDRSRRTLVESQGARAFLASPIISGERLLGWVLVLSLDAPYAFTDQEIRLYRGLSDQAATVLRNFELLEMATTRAEQERLLADLSARMRETLDMDLILQTALREIGASMDLSQIEVQMQSKDSL